MKIKMLTLTMFSDPDNCGVIPLLYLVIVGLCKYIFIRSFYMKKCSGNMKLNADIECLYFEKAADVAKY